MALPTPSPAPEGGLSLSSCLLGHLPELCTQQALNTRLQAGLTLCSVQQTFPGYKDPRGRNGQAAARPTQGGWALESGGSVSLVQLGLTWPDPGHLQLAVCLLPVPTSSSPAGQVQRFPHPRLPCARLHVRAQCHQQVPAAGPGFPSCDRIRKGLQFSLTLYMVSLGALSRRCSHSPGRNENSGGR